MKKLILIVAMVMILGMATMTQATLIDRGADTLGNHLIYDTDLNITWYDYSNDPTNWYNQVSWVENLTVTMSDGRSFTNWRLPSTVEGLWSWGNDGTTTAGYNITTSEMGHLFYEELGNKGYYAEDGSYQANYGLVNKGPFSSLQGVNYYSSEYAFDPLKAWYFHFGDGHQGMMDDKDFDASFALAVSSGDIAVPEPATMLLLGLGLVGLAGVRRELEGKK